jgi:hypothetical protein
MKLLKSQEKQKSLNLMFWQMDTFKQLLARSRYFIQKQIKMVQNQIERLYYLICIPIFKKATI